jgi:CheY-like chemotaxis protein
MCYNPPGANHRLSAEKGSFTYGITGTCRKPYVLLIDDDQDDNDLLSSSLTLLGIRVKAFLSGYQALSYLNLQRNVAQQPSLIILDYNLPGLNGQQVLQLLKSNEQTSAIPVVLYSTTISTDLQITAAALGAVACFTKPFTMLEFERQVQLFKDWAFSTVAHEAGR